MLKVIDADLGCFAITNRTEMAGNFELTLVGFFNNRAQLVTCDVHVGLERGRALIGPKVNHAASVVRSCQSMHDWSEGTDAFQVWCGDVHLRTDHSARVN